MGLGINILRPFDPRNGVYLFQELWTTNLYMYIKAVCVEFVWDNVKNKKTTFDFTRPKQRTNGVIHPTLFDSILQPNKFDREKFSLGFFKLEPRVHDNFYRFEGYILDHGDYELSLNIKTRLTPISNDVEIPHYPMVTSITTLLNDTTSSRMLIDVVGRVISWHIKFSNAYTEGGYDFSIQDSSGEKIRFLLHYNHNSYPVKSCRALADRGIIYVSRVKPVRINEPIVLTYLKSTPLTTIVYESDMPEADAIRNMV